MQGGLTQNALIGNLFDLSNYGGITGITVIYNPSFVYLETKF